MGLIVGGHTGSDRTEPGTREPSARAAALWSALAADRRALDERTARLRAMRLIRGDDATA